MSAEEQSTVEVTFHDELRALINRRGLENKSGTPDFLLANYLESCLKVYEETIRNREKWHGRPVNTCAGIEGN